MSNRIKIGLRIQRQRLIHGLSQEGLAEALGVSRQSVSKWELGQAMPDVEKIIQLTRLWDITTDELLLEKPQALLQPSTHILNWGMYLIVKDFRLSIAFYEKLLNRRATILGHNRFAQFRFNGNCILSIMQEGHLENYQAPPPGSHKFALNLWTTDLAQESARIEKLNIGPFTEITCHHPTYYYFSLLDPDYNLIEITGEYYESGILE